MRAGGEKDGARLYPESDLLVTDLYPVSMCRGKHIIIFYGAEGDLKEYQDLKALKKALVESKAYHGDARYQLAYRMGKLLSYTDDAIARMIAANPEKELPPGDKVLCDAPCSGLGIIRRKPEIRYKNKNMLDSLPDLQYLFYVYPQI